MGTMQARTDPAEPGQREAGEMAKPVVPLAAASLDFKVATGATLERQLLAIRTELSLVEKGRLLVQLADDTASDCAMA